jgi:hypothetical protein
VTTGPYTWADSMVLDGYYETDGGEHLRVEHVELMCSMVLDLCRAPSKAARELAAMRTEALNDREAAYIDAALNDACQRLASTSEGYRHAAVYYTARALGEYVGGGVLERGRARARITQAAEALYGEGLWNVEVKTIEQGLDKGAREPRGIPDGARRLLARIAEADDPMSIVELYGENNPELLRDFGAPDLDGELKVALKNAYHVGGGLALARFTHLVVTS